MPEKKPLWKRAVEAFGLGHAIHTIIQMEFVQTWLLPVVWTMITGASGVLGGLPLMWVLMASAIVFAAITTAVLAIWALRAQTSPQNRLTSKAVFHCDLTPREAPLIGNRQVRRAQGKQTPKILSSS